MVWPQLVSEYPGRSPVLENKHSRSTGRTKYQWTNSKTEQTNKLLTIEKFQLNMNKLKAEKRASATNKIQTNIITLVPNVCQHKMLCSTNSIMQSDNDNRN